MQQPPRYIVEDFRPLWTREIRLKQHLHRVGQTLNRVGLFPTDVLYRFDYIRAEQYLRLNSVPWEIPERLQRYDGLKAVVAKAASIGCVFMSLPAGFLGGTGDIAMTYLLPRGPSIFIERQPVDAYHTTDTVLHEIIHATGIRTGRMKLFTNMARDSGAYWYEEAVAVMGAYRLANAFDLPRLQKSIEEMDTLMSQVIQTQCKEPINFIRAIRDANLAVAYLGWEKT